MKTKIKLLIATILLDIGMASSAQATHLTCENDNLFIQVSYRQGPRGGDLVLVELDNSTNIEFLTTFSTKKWSTRCGIETSETAGLYFNNYQTKAKGHISIDRKGHDCGWRYIQATIDIQVDDQQIKETLSCN